MGHPLMIIEYLLMILGALMGVVFLSLLERKTLGLVQIRKGPNKVTFMGLLQSLVDAIKLFLKEQMYMYKISIIYMMLPLGMVSMGVLLWSLYPMDWEVQSFELGIFLFLVILSLESYFLLFMSWVSNNSFAMLGSFRGVSQMISYEIVMFLIFIGVVVLDFSYSFSWMIKIQSLGLMNVMIFYFYFMILYFCLLAEMNRTPMDLVEAESELVSGFNIEYMSYGLSFIFIVEFNSIMIMMQIVGLMMFGILGLIIGSLMTMGVLIIRASYPRYRYDKVMMLCWSVLMPMVLGYFYLLFLM